MCRVPEECPEDIARLCLACTANSARARPSAQEAMDVIEGSLLVIPGISAAVAPLPPAAQSAVPLPAEASASAQPAQGPPEQFTQPPPCTPPNKPPSNLHSSSRSSYSPTSPSLLDAPPPHTPVQAKSAAVAGSPPSDWPPDTPPILQSSKPLPSFSPPTGSPNGPPSALKGTRSSVVSNAFNLAAQQTSSGRSPSIAPLEGDARMSTHAAQSPAKVSFSISQSS